MSVSLAWARARRAALGIPLVGRNAAVNVAGRAWTMLMSFVFVPFYIHLLGVEAYGIIGFHATLMAVFSFLDLGLPTTLNREVARRAAQPEQRGTLRTVVRTLETVYSGIGLVIGAIIVVSADALATRWLNVGNLGGGEVTNAIRLIGLVIACQWPISLYTGGLLGLQHQTTATVLQMISMTVRGGGSVLVLLLVDDSLTAFFVFQVAVSVATTIATRIALTTALPRAQSIFDWSVLATMWKFALGMTGAALLTIALMQMDKTLLSAMLPLEEYAHYVLAYTLAAAGGFIGGPVFNAVFPRLTELVAAREAEVVRRAFLSQAQILGVVLSATALAVILFAHELLLFWTQDPSVADAAAPIARLLAIGAGLNGAMVLPYALTLAHGKAHYTVITNAAAVAVLAPLLYVFAARYGAVGAAFAWPILNIGYVVLVCPILLRCLLPGAYLIWLAQCLLLPAGAAGVVMGAIRLLAPDGMPRFIGFLVAGAAGAAGLAAAALSTPQGRKAARWAFAKVARGRPMPAPPAGR